MRRDFGDGWSATMTGHTRRDGVWKGWVSLYFNGQKALQTFSALTASDSQLDDLAKKLHDTVAPFLSDVHAKAASNRKEPR